MDSNYNNGDGDIKKTLVNNSTEFCQGCGLEYRVYFHPDGKESPIIANIIRYIKKKCCGKKN